MRIIDSHCHLNILKKKQNHSETLANAHDNNVVGMLNIGIDIETAPEVIAQTQLQENIWASVGIHPCHCPSTPMTEDDINAIITYAKHPKVIAIGESGLDFFHSKEEDSTHQLGYFREHIHLSNTLQLPIIIHCRHAHHKIIKILQENHADQCGGVMHCFAEDWATAKAALDMGFYISFSGILTYPKSGPLREVAKRIPLDRLLVETDSPYLSPQPVRKTFNQPAYVKYTLSTLAQMHAKEVAEMADITSQNFTRCFNVQLA